MKRYILSIDQGTTGTTVALVDSQGKICGQQNVEFRQIFPQPGWVEHNPEEIWQSFVKACKKLFSGATGKKKQVAAIGITNQRETVVVWDRKTGKPIHNAIVWQCRRTSEACKKLKAKKLDQLIYKKTGLVTDPYFSATKIQWLLDNVKGARKKANQGELILGTIDTYLLWRLTGGQEHKTDVSNASRTMLMNLKAANWDEELLNLFKVPDQMLPEICPSSGVFGKTKKLSFLPDDLPISGIAGDQQAALFGQTCYKPGEAKCTFGTGSFLLMNTGEKLVRSKSKLLTTIAWQLGQDKKVTYALEGGAFVCGAAVQWLRDQMGLIKKSSDVERLAQTVKDNGGVQLIPAFVGLGAPYWDSDVRAAIVGLTRGANKGHIARATLEAMALQNMDILHAMEKDLGDKLKRLRVDGGATGNNLLMQIQADYLGVKIDRPEIVETTVAGAAYLAGLGVGFWKNTGEIKKVWKINQTFKNKMSAAQRKKRIEDWHREVKKLLK